MIFENEKAYFVKKHTSNNTNTKSYDLLNNNFIFEVTFKCIRDNKLKQKEQFVLGRVGYNMGVVIQDNNYAKFVWWETNDSGEQIYRDIFLDDIDIFDTNTIKVIKKNNEFIVYLNNMWYDSYPIEHKLYDYSDKMIYIGVANPYCESGNYLFFNGEIIDVKIYNSSNEIIDDLYLWFDFQNNSNFKTFDKSGNGNHGELFESNKIKIEKNIEFNKIARPAKIV